jgi:hypothetical protein
MNHGFDCFDRSPLQEDASHLTSFRERSRENRRLFCGGSEPQ